MKSQYYPILICLGILCFLNLNRVDAHSQSIIEQRSAWRSSSLANKSKPKGKTLAMANKFGPYGRRGSVAAELSVSKRILDGALIHKETLVEMNIPSVGQVGYTNCLAACIEAVDKSFGGKLSQDDVRKLPGLTGDPYEIPLTDMQAMGTYQLFSGRRTIAEMDKESSPQRILFAMQNGIRVIINYSTLMGGHSIVLNKIVQKTAHKRDGTVDLEYLYYAMDPGRGGAQHRIKESTIRNALNIFYIFPKKQ